MSEEGPPCDPPLAVEEEEVHSPTHVVTEEQHVDPNVVPDAIIEQEDVLQESIVEEDGEDPWLHTIDADLVHAAHVRKAQPVLRETIHYVIEGTAAEGGTPNTLKSYFIMSILGSRKDTQLITICPISGELHFRGIPGFDVFRSEGEARAHLTDKLGLRIVNAAKGPALLGAVQAGPKTLVGVVTASEARLILPSGEPVYTVTEVKWIEVRVSHPCHTNFAQTFASLITEFSVPNLHFYTFPFVDITRPWPPTEDTPDPHFIWNSFLSKPFDKLGLGEWTVKLLQGVAAGKVVSLGMPVYPTLLKKRLKRFYKKYNPAKMSEIKAVMSNYREDELFAKLVAKYGEEPTTDLSEEYDSDEGKPNEANVSLLTRRWSRHAGTRYNARGIDATGAPANELECELLFSSADKWASHVWRRGSVPIKWSSKLGSTVKVGQATFVICKDPFADSHRYWDNLARRYAGWCEGESPSIVGFSLLHTEPEHGELLLVENYQESLREVRRHRPNTKVELLGFDWHRTVKQLGLGIAVDGAWKLFAGPLAQHGVSSGTVEVTGLVDNKSLFESSPTVTEKKEPKRKGAFATIRGLVSQQKLRFTADAFNLDLTYITPRLIAMGFPSYGAEGYYRNPVDEVERFFETRHKGHYKIYNLCTEREYDSETRFKGNFRRWPFEDHNAPAPISMIPDLVADAQAYLAEDPANVIAAHCKAGKGRTGVMISALLMNGACPDAVPPRNAAAALGYFGAARTKDGHGVTIPSQRRYLYYYQDMLSRQKGKVPPIVRLRITKIVVQSPVKYGTPPNLYALVNESPKWVMTKPGKQYFDRGPTVTKWDSRRIEAPQQAGARFTLFDLTEGNDHNGGITVSGDVKVVFMSQRSILGDEHLFHFGFHTSFIDADVITKGEPVRFCKAELDGACKDEKHSKFRRDLQVEVYFAPCNQDAPVDEDVAVPEGEDKDEGEGAAHESPVVEDETGDDGDVHTAVQCRQKGIVRMNCVDSLDRTNLASFFMALQIAAELRRTIRGDDEKPFPLQGKEKTLDAVKESLGDSLVGHLAEVFVANGDVCSLLYTNTQATHTDSIREMSTRLGKAQSNAMLSVKRRYHNTVSDTNRHNTILAFLGQAKHPVVPPLLASVHPACILSVVPHVKVKNADPTTLLYVPPTGGHPWVAPSSAPIELLAYVPHRGKACAVGICFRCDATGDDENFPTSFEVLTGTSVDNMQPVLEAVTIPRAKDHTWLYYPLVAESGEEGARLVAVRFTKFIGSYAVLGGIRILATDSEAPSEMLPVQEFGQPPQPAHHVIQATGDKLVVALDDYVSVESVSLSIPEGAVIESVSTGMASCLWIYGPFLYQILLISIFLGKTK